MRILGIDPALKTTGFGIIDSASGRFSLVTSGTITTASNSILPQRLDKIHRSVSDIIRNYRPDVLVLEKVFVHYHHPTTAYLLGEARGIICLCCAQNSVQLVEYAATQVKKALVGRGHASKEQIQRMVCALLGIKETPKFTDITDALALAMAYSYFEKMDALKRKLSR